MTMMKSLHLKTCQWIGNWDPSTLHLRLVRKSEFEFDDNMQIVKYYMVPAHTSGFLVSDQYSFVI
jgi:hypothetical protein